MIEPNKNKTGYKKTKLGWIPEDWSIIELGEATTLLTNGFVGKATDHYTDSADGVIYIQGFNIEENSFNYTGIKKVTRQFHERNKKSCLKENDLLTIQTGDVGLTSIVPKNLIGSNCHALIISRFKQENFWAKFFVQYFNSYIGRRRLKEIETGSTMKHLNVKDMQKWEIPLPPLPEQQKIAQILSTWDKAIETTQKLIEKKQQLKKGLMQQLLTGKKRFPEFVKSPKMKQTKLGMIPEDWEVSKLGDIGKVKMCKRVLKNETSSDGDIPFYKIGTFGNKPDAYISMKLYDDLRSRFSFPNVGDILLSASGTLGRTVVYNGESSYYQDSNIVWIENNEAIVLNKFLYYVYKIVKYNSEGATIQRLYNSIISSAMFLRPSIEEQQKIAQVLSSADKEIERLTNQLDKLREQKKGLMQVLLTGKIRVKTN